MTKRWRYLWLLILTVSVTAPQKAGAQDNALTEQQAAEIMDILAHRVDSLKISPAIVVGVIGEQGRQVIGYGTMDGEGTASVGGETIFEIGSITKVFTTLLLADLVEQGKVSLGDPISKFLPDSVAIPDSTVDGIELVQLASHTSGLPRMPSNFSPQNRADPFADYDVAKLYGYLESTKLQVPAGGVASYSNVGMGLLGHILSLVTGESYQSLLEEKICGPLQMSSTVIELNKEQEGRLAAGHYLNGKRAANWNFQALAGAGAIRSTADDLLKFLAVNLGYTESGLSDALVMCYKPRALLTRADSVGLAWITSKRYGSRIIWHNGGTGGYRSFIGFCPEKGLGVVVLVNSDQECDDLGFHLLEPRCQLKEQESQPDEVAVAPEILQRYTGLYDLGPDLKFAVNLKDGRLMVQLTGQPALPVYAKSETEFFYKVVDAQITFVADESGKVTELVLHQNGMDQPAYKEGSGKTPAGGRKAIKLDPSRLKKYEGEYQLQPGMKFYVTLQGNQLLVQLTGQPSFPVFPESETEFFYKVVDAQITFKIDQDGKVTGLVLHQGGQDVPAEKIGR